MQKLYDASGHIKIEKIEEFLRRAKRKEDLRGVPSEDIDDFMDSFREEMENFKSRVGSQISKSELEFLFRQLEKNHSDKISPSELRKIEEILLNDDYEIG